MRISNSFSEGEIQVMDFIVQTLLRGGSPSMAVRNKDFASLCRKIMAMKAKVIEKQLAEELGETAPETAEAAAPMVEEAEVTVEDVTVEETTVEDVTVEETTAAETTAAETTAAETTAAETTAEETTAEETAAEETTPAPKSGGTPLQQAV